MKLLYCPICQDILKLRKESVICQCNASAGYLVTGWVVVRGKTRVLGLHPRRLHEALREDAGKEFSGWVIPGDAVGLKKVSVERYVALTEKKRVSS